MKNLAKLMTFTGAAAIALLGSPVAAQSAEETVNIGLIVEVDIGQAVISGLEDVSLNWTADSVALVEDSQAFCIFTPTQFFSLTTTGVNSDGSGDFFLVDAAQTDPALQRLVYLLAVTNTFDGSNRGVSVPMNGVPDTGIDSDLFNTDATCSDGENVTLGIFVTAGSAPSSGGLNNLEIINQISDGITHNFTDQITLLLEPEI